MLTLSFELYYLPTFSRKTRLKGQQNQTIVGFIFFFQTKLTSRLKVDL